LGTEDASANSSGESSADGQSEPAAHQEESQGGSTEESSGSSTQVIERVVVVNRTAGDGPAAAQGQTAVVDYTMSKQDGSVLYSTDERGEPFTFVIGNGKFKPMFDDAVVGMRVGGQRVVTYPPGAGWTRILGRRLSEEDRFVLELKLRELDPGASEPAASSSASVKTLVDCSAPENQQPGAIKSLLSYSKHYHSQAVSGRERAHSCRQALSYRGSAYCQNPADQTVASLLAETQKVCSGQQ